MSASIFLSEYFYFFVLMLVTAVPVGFFAGLFGIGGGLITVPFLYFIFQTLNVDQNYIMHLAIGTSFSIIVPTSIVSVITHKNHGSVDFRIIKTYGLFVILGVFCGTILASILDTKSLLLFFTIVVFCLGAYLLNLQEKAKKIKPNFKLIPRVILGLISGVISSTMGIGGAVMNVPVLRYFGYPINKAIGSAAAIGCIVALFAGVGFIISGSYLQANLPFSIGFINIPAFLIFIPITTFMAKVGANTTHKVDKSRLQRMFGIFLYVIGTIFLYRYLSF